MKNGVVITGYGCLTASGGDAAVTWEAILAGESGIQEVETWDSAGWPYRLAGEIKDYSPRELISDRKLLKFITRQDVIGLNAVAQAVAHSGIIEHRDELADPTSSTTAPASLSGRRPPNTATNTTTSRHSRMPPEICGSSAFARWRKSTRCGCCGRCPTTCWHT